MPAQYPTAVFRSTTRRDIRTQVIVELNFRVDCLYAAAGIAETKALLRAISEKPFHDFSAIIDHILETYSEYFDRVKQ